MLKDHFEDNRQIALLSGPRQVGKSTVGLACADVALSWDDLDQREDILSGPRHVVEKYGLNQVRKGKPTILFDELHKFPSWKVFLKGFFDSYGTRIQVIVTGSSRLNVYRRVGDSMMGRYFLYRMHPITVAETVDTSMPDPKRILRRPKRSSKTALRALWEHGGFPEPFLRRDQRFTRRWQKLRMQQLVREDLREMTQIQQIDQIEVLVKILNERSGQQLNYARLSKHVRVDAKTVARWIETLNDLHFGFTLRPWTRNVSRSLLKEPKWYLRDWSQIDDLGQRAETYIACHLLKAVEGWTDLGFGEFELAYVRDKEKREVDFVVVRDGKPWFLVEAKHSPEPVSPELAHFQQVLGAPYSFQVTVQGEYVDADCFATPGPPLVVPAATFFSQMI